MSDREIVDRLWSRDETGIAVMQEQYGAYCYEISLRIVEDREDARECVNDTWLQAWNSIPPNRPSSLKHYVAKIVRNLSLNRLEKKQADKRGGGKVEAVYEEVQELFSRVNPIEEMIERQVFAERLNSFLSTLPAQQRNIFLRRFWFFETPAEIAKRYGLKEKAVYNRLFSLRKQFREFWEEQ